MELKNKVAIITGASSGIGKAVAHNLNEVGVKLVLAGRREDRLVALKGELQQVAVVQVARRVDRLAVDVHLASGIGLQAVAVAVANDQRMAPMNSRLHGDCHRVSKRIPDDDLRTGDNQRMIGQCKGD